MVSSVIFDDGAFPGPPHPRPLSPKAARGELILPVTHLLERGELVCCPRPFGERVARIRRFHQPVRAG